MLTRWRGKAWHSRFERSGLAVRFLSVMNRSLCTSCVHHRQVISGKGSRFLLCQKSLVDPRFAKYPPQPVIKCVGYEEASGDRPETTANTN